MTRTLLRAAAALAFAVLLVGPSAQAHAPGAATGSSGMRHARPGSAHTTNEWLKMGRDCAASVTAG
jgi:hypothetical protein